MTLYTTLLSADSISDSRGKKIEFSKPFSRIISLYPAHTENLIQLGASDKITAVSKNSLKTAEKLKIPTISTSDDPERFLKLNPDLILIRPMHYRAHKSLFRTLEKLGVTVAALQPVTVNEMYTYWLKLGKLSGRRSEAEQMIRKFKDDLDKFRKITSKIPEAEREKVYFESIHRRMRTFSKTSMAMFVLENAGGINIADDAPAVHNSNIASYSKEKILAKANQIDVFLSQKGRMNNITVEKIKNEPGFQVIKAVKNNKVFIVPEEIVSRPTPELIKGIKTIYNLLYNEKPEKTKHPQPSDSE
jgi:iron complex transport system substrate-binding protein